MEAPKFGSYEVIEELGSGGIACVYKASQESLKRRVAIKALKPTIGPTSPFAAQLEREARLLGELSHPNIVLLHDFVKTADQMYLVLEYVDGFSLAELGAKRTRLSPEMVAQIGAEMARGLAHAHERGIVHRDVKPANVLLSKRGEVKLVDFGIAQRERVPTADEPLAREQESRRGQSLEEHVAFGTPAYMSPEQILGDFVDARSDIFSLGVVLYELLAGVRPEGKAEGDKRAAALRTRRDPPTPLRARAPDVPRALDRIVMRAIEKLPADRFSSALAMADLLDDFVRARVRGPRHKIITRALAKARLLNENFDESIAAVLDEKRPSLRPALFGFAVLATLIIAGGATLQLTGRSSHDAIGGVGGPLELVPLRMGFLRVVATPWAEVAIDGQHVDTTPFARAIPLPAGTHYVTLVHPSARPEKRVVRINVGEATLLDVTLDVSAGSLEGPSDAGKEGGGA